MQYILTQSELDSYRDLEKRAYEHLHKIIQDLCIEIAEHKPIIVSRNKDMKPEPWGCILVKHPKPMLNSGYCDECPVNKICPYPDKEWSK